MVVRSGQTRPARFGCPHLPFQKSPLWAAAKSVPGVDARHCGRHDQAGLLPGKLGRGRIARCRRVRPGRRVLVVNLPAPVTVRGHMRRKIQIEARCGRVRLRAPRPVDQVFLGSGCSAVLVSDHFREKADQQTQPAPNAPSSPCWSSSSASYRSAAQNSWTFGSSHHRHVESRPIGAAGADELRNGESSAEGPRATRVVNQ